MVVFSTIWKHHILYFHFTGSTLFLWELNFSRLQVNKVQFQMHKTLSLSGVGRVRKQEFSLGKKLSKEQYLHNSRLQTPCTGFIFMHYASSVSILGLPRIILWTTFFLFLLKGLFSRKMSPQKNRLENLSR